MQSPTQENQLRQKALPAELTADGIKQLFMQGPNQQFILQIIKITEDYSQNRMCQLSDGYCYITCLLTGQARLKNIKCQLEVFDVIRICREDIIILGLQRTPSLQLCNLQILGMRCMCSIGQPFAYMTYFQHDFTNPKGSRKIADGQRVLNALTLPNLIDNFPHVPTKWILKAKVVKKPDSINIDRPFMVIRLMDEKQNTIEGVFFGQAALDAHKKLAYGKQYLFNNGQIKTKKGSVAQFQIKFTEQSQIIPIETMKSNNNNSSSSGQQKHVTISDITNSLAEGKMITITGKVFKLRVMGKGRCLQIIDQNQDVIQIFLWEEIKDQVKQGITYIFQNLRTKKFNTTLSLQSVRNKTTVKRAPYQIERLPSIQGSKKPQNKIGSMKYKQLKQSDKIMNVSELLDISITQKQYKDVCGFIVINTMYMDTKNFFKVQCPDCTSKQISANPLMCRKCSCANPIIRWNLRCHIIDEKEDMKCVMNEDLCEKIFKMSSVQGFKKLTDDSQGLKKKINEISHLEGIFKIKLNPYKQNVYYNILQFYRNDSKALLKKAYKQLGQTMKKFVQIK